MTPKLSYRIWFSPRCGSTLLCEALSSTGIAGRPGEFFNTDSDLLQQFEVADYPSLRQKLWKIGSTSNGVLGIKHSLFHKRYEFWLDDLARIRGLDRSQVSESDIWDDLFPNCRHIFICRRNKIRQAVSWWKAIQDDQWHLRGTEKRKEVDDFYKDRYVFAAISTLVKQTILREAAIQSYFDRHNIQAHTVVYEDFIDNYEDSVLQTLDFLGLNTTQVQVAEKPLRRTANGINATWVARFREEYQDGGDKVW